MLTRISAAVEVFDNISPSIRLVALVYRLCVVDEPKFRMIHDLMFSAGRLPTRNNDVDFAQAPDCLLGHMLTPFSVCNLSLIHI